LLLRQRHFEATEEVCRKALGVAEKQEAKLWELRAAAGLARLHHDRVASRKVATCPAPIYGSFTEDLDTQDLKEAKALIEALAARQTVL
jgi:predicted ATPase